MDAGGASVGASTQWYARSAADGYIAAATARRSALEASIAAAHERTERSRTALSLHRTMAAMLLDTQRELAETRRAAEVRAAEIIGAAKREAEALEGATGTAEQVPPGDHGEPEATASPDATEPEVLDAARPMNGTDVRGSWSHHEPDPHHATEPAIDLADLARLDASVSSSDDLAPPRFRNNGDHDDLDSDKFLAFLRGSLVDEEPLGPRPE